MLIRAIASATADLDSKRMLKFSRVGLPRGRFDLAGLAGCVLPTVLDLDLSGCGVLTDRGLEELVSTMPQLTTLRLTMNARLHQPRLTCPKLRMASLSICTHLDDVAVEHLTAHAPELAELSLWRCASLREMRVEGAQLKRLNLCECFELRDVAVERFRESCPRLQSLQLAGCASLASPATLGGQHLTVLDVSDVLDLEDGTLSAACASSLSLQRLDISRCESLVVPIFGGEQLQVRCSEAEVQSKTTEHKGHLLRSPPLLHARY